MPQGENMPISLKTQAERTAKTPIQARRARDGSLCGFHGAAELVPIQQQTTRRCADVRERSAELQRRRRNACGRSPAESRATSGEAGQSRGVVCTPRRSHLPAVRAVSGIYGGVPKAAKNSPRALQNEKSPPFQGKQRGSNEKHEVNTEKW